MLGGRLRDRITILERSTTRTALGNEETWTAVETRWGRMALVSARGVAQFQQAHNSVITHRAVFRHRVNLTPQNHRLRWRDQDYEVVSPPSDVDGTGKETTVEVRKL